MTGAVDESDGDPNQAKSYLLMDWLRELSDQDLRAWIEYCEDHRAHLKSTDPWGGWFRSNHISAAYKVIDERRAQGSVVDRPEIDASTPVMTVETYHPTESGWTRDRRVVPKPSGPANDSEPIWMPGSRHWTIITRTSSWIDDGTLAGWLGPWDPEPFDDALHGFTEQLAAENILPSAAVPDLWTDPADGLQDPHLLVDGQRWVVAAGHLVPADTETLESMWRLEPALKQHLGTVTMFEAASRTSGTLRWSLWRTRNVLVARTELDEEPAQLVCTEIGGLPEADDLIDRWVDGLPDFPLTVAAIRAAQAAPGRSFSITERELTAGGSDTCSIDVQLA